MKPNSNFDEHQTSEFIHQNRLQINRSEKRKSQHNISFHQMSAESQCTHFNKV